MEENSLQGNIAQIPFPHLLFEIWQKEKSGHLRIQKDRVEKRLSFEKGNIVIERESFPEIDFLKTLVEKKIIGVPEHKKCEDYASQNKTSLLRALIELDIFSASGLWKLIEDFFKADFFSFFDLSKAVFLFNPEPLPRQCPLLSCIQTLPLILEGVRQMRNFELIEAFLPDCTEILQILSPYYLNLISLEPHEKYLLSALDNNSLKNIYHSSEIGKKESQKIVFALLSLGLVGASGEKNRNKRLTEFSSAELDKILSAFNDKCSYIYKYISKEIGPVALNVLEKCLDEIKAHLGPLFQKIELSPDGTIEMKSILRTNTTLSNLEKEKNFIRGLNEILAAEVLTVKKTLGNDHERALVKNLEKIGEPS